MDARGTGSGRPIGPRRIFTTAEAEGILVAIDKSHQLGGNFPSAEALDLARRILIGETSPEEARAEIAAKYGPVPEVPEPEQRRGRPRSAPVTETQGPRDAVASPLAQNTTPATRATAGHRDAPGFASPRAAIQAFAAGTLTEDELVELLGTWPYAPIPDRRDPAGTSSEARGLAAGSAQELLAALNRGLIDRGLYSRVRDGIQAHRGGGDTGTRR